MTMEESNALSSTAVNDDSLEIMLDRSFLYQNKTTGSASTTTLTARQLCRILCPAVAGVSANINSDTVVIGFDVTSNQYDEKGWRAAKTVEVLRESCVEWYYAGEKAEGPVSCRALAKLLNEGSITIKTKVWSANQPTKNGGEQKNSPSWTPIEELPNLQAALKAFDTTPAPWKINGGRNEKAAEATNGSLDNSKQTYDASAMTFDAGSGTKLDEKNKSKEVQDELEAFLSSTADMGGDSHVKVDDDDEEVYESDGGTVYARCPQTGNWVHSDLVQKPKPEQSKEPKPAPATNKQNNNKKRKRPKFSAKHSKCWIYVTGLPTNCNQEEVTKFFSRVGIIDLDPETQAPKVKLYRHRDGPQKGQLKGDASICYARPESVDLALQILDEAPFRADAVEKEKQHIVRVSKAKFEQHGDTYEKRKGAISNAKRKVAKLAAIQAVDWDEGDNGRISGGRKGLRIIVLKHMFDPNQLEAPKEDAILEKLEKEIHSKCQEWGVVEKITIFSKNPEGVVIVKFAQPTAASTAIQEYDGLEREGRHIKASFWDGVTDYTVRDEEKEQEEIKKRQDEFGDWLESQEVPEELRLQVEGQS